MGLWAFTLVYLLFGAPCTWVAVHTSPWGWSLPRTNPPLLTAPPRSGKAAGGTVHGGESRRPQEQEKGPNKETLLFLTGGVHTHCCFPTMGGRVPRMTEEGGGGMAEIRSPRVHQGTAELTLHYSGSHPSGIYLLPPGSGHSYSGARGRKFLVCWEQVLSFPPELPRTWWTKGTGGSLLGSAAAQWPMTA